MIILKTMSLNRKLVYTLIIIFLMAVMATAQDFIFRENNPSYHTNSISIKSTNGNFYAYVVLLFNENPHFVNMIQKDNIPMKIIGNEGFHVKEYKNYIKRLGDVNLKKLARSLLHLYLEPGRFTNQQLLNFQNILAKRNIILKFSRDNKSGSERISLDYCIFGKKRLVTIKHPLFKINEKIFNIQPFIYYDEFSTSNSTFYYDMIYINQSEVYNDSIISQKIIRGENVNSLYFVGSHITDDIKYCLKQSFKHTKKIRSEIWKMFIIHELTHKILNNNYNNFDQVSGEELSLISTIYANPYLGLSVLYSYLNYNVINPHRIAAVNFIHYVSHATGNPEIIVKPGLIKYLNSEELKALAKKKFFSSSRHLHKIR